MVPIARRNLLEDKVRLAVGVGGVALSLMLVLLLGGFLTGMYRQITAYVDNTSADYYVAQKGVGTLQGASSVIPFTTVDKVATIPGVSTVVPIFTQYAILDLHERKVPTFLVGYEPQRGGGPWRLSAGRAVVGKGEVVVDDVLAQRHGLQVGDHLTILSEEFEVVGLSAGTSSWMVGLVFLHHDAAAALLRADGATSYVLVSGDAGTALEERLQQALPDLSVLRDEAIARNDVAYLSSAFTTPLRLMVAIAIAIGGLLVGLTVYTATVERAREYGVLKAIGMRNHALYGTVVRQAAGTVGLGFVVSLALVWLVAAAIQSLWPQFLIVVDTTAALQSVGGALTMALVAALLPVRYIANIDPARIFRR